MLTSPPAISIPSPAVAVAPVAPVAPVDPVAPVAPVSPLGPLLVTVILDEVGVVTATEVELEEKLTDVPPVDVCKN